MVPLVTVIPAVVRPVTGSENVNVNVIGEFLVAVPDGVTVAVGAAVSIVNVLPAPGVSVPPESEALERTV